MTKTRRGLGRKGSDRIGSDRIGSDRIGSDRIGSDRIGNDTRFAIATTTILLLGNACATDAPQELGIETISTSQSAAMVDNSTMSVAESADDTDVAVSWKETLGGKVKKFTDSLTAQLTNNTSTVQVGRLVLISSGLDGRLVSRPMGTFKLPANGKQTVLIPVSAIPIQTEIAPCFADLQVEYDRPDGVVRVSTNIIYYIFNGGYSNIELYSNDEVRRLPKAGLRTSDPMSIKGRVFDVATNVIREIDDSAKAASTTGGQGLSIPGAVDAVTGRALRSKVTASSAATALSKGPNLPAAAGDALIQVCTNWRIQYTDAGFGEDFWPGNAWGSRIASFVWMQISLVGQPTFYWVGNTDSGGCTGWFYAPIGAQLMATQYADWVIDSTHNIWFDSFNHENQNETYIDTVFTVPSSGMEPVILYTYFNDNAVQAAAVSGLILWRNSDRLSQGLSGLGLRSGSHYVLYADVGCPPGYDPHTSCGSGADRFGMSNSYFGSQSGGNGTPAVKWKYIIAHEVGHGVRQNGLGIADSNDYTSGNPPFSNHACRCDWVTSNGSHCLNSRETFDVAANEGFSQFFGTKLFNDDSESNAKFVNYKIFQNSNSLWDRTSPPLAKDGYGAADSNGNYHPWMREKCNSPLTGYGVEWDWLRFLYNVGSTDNGQSSTRTDFWDIFAIYKLACNGNDQIDCTSSPRKVPKWNTPPQPPQDSYYTSIVEAAFMRYDFSYDDPRYLRFVNAGTNQGVNY